MAFSLFTKQTKAPKPAAPVRPGAERRPSPAAGDPRHGGGSPHERDFHTTVRLALSEDWSPKHSRIEVSDSAPGLTPVLENAALLFANGQLDKSRDVLVEGIRSDRETQLAVLAWLALFDILQRQGDRSAFDQLALQYVVVFERSAPGWEERGPKRAVAKAMPNANKQGRVVALIGELNSQSQAQIEALDRAAQTQMPLRLDVGGLVSVHEDGARILADTLRALRRRGVALGWVGGEKLRETLHKRLGAGAPAGEGCWLLMLELLQWQNDPLAFDERAVDYAVTFEVSPPSWEPLSPAQLGTVAVEVPVAAVEDDPESELLALSGPISGPADPQIARVYDFAAGRDAFLVDMTAVDRIDFVAAGSLYNAIQQLFRRDTTVHITGASAIIRALLLLIGIPPRHFAKRNV